MQINLKPAIFNIDFYGTAAVIAVCLVTYLTVIVPINNRLQQQKKVEQDNLQKQEDSEKQLAYLQNLARQRQKLAAQLSHSRDVLRENTGLAEIIRQLGVYTDRIGITLEETIPGDTNTYEHFSKTDLKIRLTGSFPQTFELLKFIKTQLPFIRIANLAMSSTDGINAALTASVSDCDVTVNCDVFSPK